MKLQNLEDVHIGFLFSSKKKKRTMKNMEGELRKKKKITFWSKSLSHMSLIMQPAPLMMRAPTPNKVSILKSGRCPGEAAIAILQVQGQ